MELHKRLHGFSQHWLPLILGAYIILQPLLDILTSLGAKAGHSVTAGVVVRTLFIVMGFFYVLFVSQFKGKKWCLLILGAFLVYLALFMARMFSLGGLSLCLSNCREVIKTFFAPFALIFLYTVYRQYGYLISTRTMAVTGGLYAGIILIAFLTHTSNVSYGNSGYGYNGWFYAANEISCIVAITAPITICYCLKILPTITKKSWWKGMLIAFVFLSIAFSANFIGTKIVFGITLVYCFAAFVWSVIQYVRQRDRETAIRAIVSGALCLLVFGMYFFSPLQSYLNNVYLEMFDEDSEQVLLSWDEAIQNASRDTWLRELIDDNPLLKRLDQILSRRLLSSSPSVQVYSEGGVLTKLLGIGYADTPSYGRSIEFMVEMDPFGILIRHGILGFLVYFVPYLSAAVYLIIQFFKRPAIRLSSLEYCSYLYASLASFAIAAIAGHALVSPAVSTFVLVLGLTLWAMTQRQNQECQTV